MPHYAWDQGYRNKPGNKQTESQSDLENHSGLCALGLGVAAGCFHHAPLGHLHVCWKPAACCGIRSTWFTWELVCGCRTQHMPLSPKWCLPVDTWGYTLLRPGVPVGVVGAGICYLYDRVADSLLSSFKNSGEFSNQSLLMFSIELTANDAEMGSLCWTSESSAACRGELGEMCWLETSTCSSYRESQRFLTRQKLSGQGHHWAPDMLGRAAALTCLPCICARLTICGVLQWSQPAHPMSHGRGTASQSICVWKSNCEHLEVYLFG